MPTLDIPGAYELLRRAMQQQYLLQQIRDFDSALKAMPRYDPNKGDAPQGGLPGRLLALLAEPDYRQPVNGSSGQTSSRTQDPNFRKLSRVPIGNRSEGVIAPSMAQNGISGSSQFVPLRIMAAGPGRRRISEVPEFSDGPRVHVNARSIPPLSVGKQGLTADGPNSRGSMPYVQQYGMAGPTYSQCVDRCLHLLPSPSGDLQSSEFRQCVGKCMGRLR